MTFYVTTTIFKINIYQSDTSGLPVVPSIGEPAGFFTGAVAGDLYVDADGFLKIVAQI